MPTLPTQGRYVTDSVVTLYEDVTDQLIADFGFEITLNLEPIKTQCPNCFQERVGRKLRSTGRYDDSNPNPLGGALHKQFASGLCPVCRGAGTINTPQTTTATSTVSWKPKELEELVEGRQLEDICKLKNLIVQDEVNLEVQMKRAISATIDGNICKLYRGPTKRGIRTRRYLVSYWIKADNA